MVQIHKPDPAGVKLDSRVQVIRHKAVCQKLQVSSAKLFDMVARGQLFKAFALVPGGRAVGWLEEDIDQWILERKAAFKQEVA